MKIKRQAKNRGLHRNDFFRILGRTPLSAVVSSILEKTTDNGTATGSLDEESLDEEILPAPKDNDEDHHDAATL